VKGKLKRLQNKENVTMKDLQHEKTNFQYKIHC